MTEPTFDPAAHMIQVQGKQEYLQVKFRVKWFRATHTDGLIVTEVTHFDAEAGYAVCKASVTIPSTGAHAENYGSAWRVDLKKRTLPENDMVEFAATTAIGRALATLGFGTEDAIDDRDPVDAPHERQGVPPPARPRPAPTAATTHANAGASDSALKRAKKACWEHVQPIYPDEAEGLAVLGELLRTSSGNLGARIDAGRLTDWEKLAADLNTGRLKVPAPELEPLF